MIYLDWNSTTPLLAPVADAMREAQRQAWANPASTHQAGRRALSLVEQTRECLGTLLDLHPRNVVFTSGGTEANNWALAGSGPLLLSRIEHPSITRVAELASEAGRPVRWLEVEGSGVVSLDDLQCALEQADSTATVCVMAANHETGVIQPLRAVSDLVRQRGARLHVDAVQWLGKGNLDVLAVADSVSLAAHKIRGPKGIGALAFRESPPPRFLLGGAQERGLRAGTQDAVLTTGFRVALEHLDPTGERHLRLAALRDALERALAAHAQRNGDGPRLPHVSNLSFAGIPGPELVAALDLESICVASGSACSAGTSEPSKVIEAFLGRERATTAVRFSLGDDTTETDIEETIAVLQRLLDA